jgi:hypothetical protein
MIGALVPDEEFLEDLTFNSGCQAAPQQLCYHRSSERVLACFCLALPLCFPAFMSFKSILKTITRQAMH